MSASQITAGIVRYGPAAFFTIVALFYTARILWLRARLGHSPVSYGTRGSLSHRIYATFRLFRVLIWLAAVARAVWPPFDRFLVPVIPLATPGVMVVGNLLMVAGFSCIVLLNFGMGRD